MIYSHQCCTGCTQRTSNLQNFLWWLPSPHFMHNIAVSVLLEVNSYPLFYYGWEDQFLLHKISGGSSPSRIWFFSSPLMSVITAASTVCFLLVLFAGRIWNNTSYLNLQVILYCCWGVRWCVFVEENQVVISLLIIHFFFTQITT